MSNFGVHAVGFPGVPAGLLAANILEFGTGGTTGRTAVKAKKKVKGKKVKGRPKRKR